MNEALPPTSATVARVVAPSWNVMVPVGVPEAGGTGVTVALRLTDCPKVDGLGEEFRLVVVAAGAGAFTACVTVGEVLTANVALPL